MSEREREKKEMDELMVHIPMVESTKVTVQQVGALTFSVDSGKKLMPLGMTKAMRDAATTRHVSKNALHVRSCSLCRHP